MQTINTEIINSLPVSSKPISETDTQANGGYSCAVGFPHRNGDVVLRDGSTVRIRAMQPNDDEALCALFQSLSEESRWLRFLSLAKGDALAAEARREAHLDHTVGLIAVTGSDERVVAHAFYAGIDEHRAE